jgi:hypothetical protein
MEEQDVRDRAEALCTALVAGDIESATADFSDELRRNLGEVVAMLPLPSSEASVESVERGGGSGFTVVLRLVGETEGTLLQTRWKERDGQPTVIEASHLSRVETGAHDGADADGAEGGGDASV